ncbi:MAG: hypothetical protein ACREPP_11265 [Rhodanobacteraceae bacterium]
MANSLSWRYKVANFMPKFFGGVDPDKRQRMLDDLGREGAGSWRVRSSRIRCVRSRWS